MSGENAMTQATDELLLTTVAPVRRPAGMWRGIPIAWLAAAVLALAFAALLLALPARRSGAARWQLYSWFCSRSGIALAGAGLVAAIDDDDLLHAACRNSAR